MQRGYNPHYAPPTTRSKDNNTDSNIASISSTTPPPTESPKKKKRKTAQMPGVELSGSCHCGAVRYTVHSSSAVPYQLCACSICRKVGGPSGSINLGGYNDTLKILRGKDKIKKYHAVLDRDTKDERRASSERCFCGECGSMLWLWDEHWPELIHPFATSIDSKLEAPEEMVCIMDGSKPEWVRWPEGKKSVNEKYGKDSLEQWHKKHGKWVE